MPLDFQQRVGPLPAWAWGVGVGGVGVVVLWWRRRSSGDAAPATMDGAPAAAGQTTATQGYGSGAVPASDPFPIYDSRGAISTGSGVGYTAGADVSPTEVGFPSAGEISDAVAIGVGAGLASQPAGPTADEIGQAVVAALPSSVPAPAPVSIPAPAPVPTPTAPPPTPGPAKGTILWTGQSEPVKATIDKLIRDRYPGVAVRWESRKRGGGLGYVAVVI